MKIWVDADACPVVIKNILFKAAERTGVQLTLIANQTIQVPRSENISFQRVAAGFDVADNEIVKQIVEGDLVITGDIPLAAEVLEKGGLALSPRGLLFSDNDIKAKLTMRDFNETLRSSGIHTGGPDELSQRDRQNFANHLDRILTSHA